MEEEGGVFKRVLTPSYEGKTYHPQCFPIYLKVRVPTPIKILAGMSIKNREKLLWPGLNPSHGTRIVLRSRVTASKSEKVDGILDGCLKLCEIEMELQLWRAV